MGKFRASELVRQIFDQTADMRATVEAQTIADCDQGSYEPLLLGIRALTTYNAFKGRKVEAFLRERLLATGKGTVMAVRFGREYSPVLYLTIGKAGYHEGEWVKYTAKERRRLALEIVAGAKATLEVDDADIVAPGLIRLWWD